MKPIKKMGAPGAEGSNMSAQIYLKIATDRRRVWSGDVRGRNEQIFCALA